MKHKLETLREKAEEVNDHVVKAQVSLASYNFAEERDRQNEADQEIINKIRDLLAEAEWLSRQLVPSQMITG
jgi:hypothetical protein